MPLQDWNLEATWDDAYSDHSRIPSINRANSHADRLIGNNLITLPETGIVVGAGFGYLCEVLSSRGFTTVGVDSSSYVESKLNTEPDYSSSAEMMFGNLSVANFRNSVKTRFNKPDFLITEDLITVLDLSELSSLLSLTEALSTTTIIHIITPDGPGTRDRVNYTWLTMLEWRTWFDNQGFSTHRLLSTEGHGEA